MNKKEKKVQGICESCAFYAYDEEYECYMCMIDMDEDEVNNIYSNKRRSCPYFRMGDDYTIVRKQNWWLIIKK